MSRDPLKPGGALEGDLFRGFLRRLSRSREPEPGERIGAWRIVSELGRGGSGVVFLAERADGAFSQQVALKWLRADLPVPGGREVLARERELLSGLDHPNIARLIDGGETEDGMLWFAMDYASGETIDRHAGTLSVTERLRLIHTLCRAVHHAHRRGLIHGDIKPSNVLVDGRGQPRLVDFGISRLKGVGIGSSYGLTPDYASPEQRSGDELTTASDIWQLGRLLDDVIGDESASDDLRAVVEQATADSPEDRYASASAMAADIDAWLHRRPVLARGGGPVYRFGLWVRRNRAVSMVSAAAMLIIVGGGVWVTLQLAEERDIARAEAERAEQALGETEVALARAEALRDFLIGLFRAAEARLPREELPDTEQLLDLGAERAMDEDGAPDAERFDMLLAIAEVYMTLGRNQQAEPLLRAAIEVGRRHVEQRPEDLARALSRKGYMEMAARNSEAAEALFVEAEEIAAGHDRAFDAFVRARARRAWLAYRRGQPAQALELLEPVIEQVETGHEPDIDQATRVNLFNTLATVRLVLGDHQRSAEVRAQTVELARQVHGPESRSHAVQLGNLASVQLRLGQFGEARSSLERAISLYDRIFDHPVVLRAAAYGNLSNLNLYTGDYGAALEAIDHCNTEWARATGRSPDDFEWAYYRKGRMLMRMGRYEQARSQLEQAVVRFDAIDNPPLTAPVMTRAWLARTLCAMDQPGAGRELLAELDDHPLPDDPAHVADIHQSRAQCLYRAGEFEPALDEIRSSLEMVDWPGHAMHRAQRYRLESEILRALGQNAAAGAAMDRAKTVLAEVGLEDHPVLE